MSTTRDKNAARANNNRKLFGGERPPRSASSLRREAKQPKLERRKSFLKLDNDEG